MSRKQFVKLGLEEQLERLKEYEIKLHEDFRMAKMHLNDSYWVTNHEEVRTRIEDIAKNYGFIGMIEETKRKLPRKKGGMVCTSDKPNWVSPYD